MPEPFTLVRVGDFTAAEKAKCAERERKMRLRVYPRWVDDGRLTIAAAEREIAIMSEIAADYRAKADAEEAAGRLL
jgi:hypothetical protein